MSHFRPSLDERDTLKKAVAKFAHDPIKSQLLSRLDAEDADYSPGNEEWNHLQVLRRAAPTPRPNRSAAGPEKESGEAPAGQSRRPSKKVPA